MIEARGVDKTFNIPDQKVDTLKERATHPFRRVEHRRLRALQSVSFDIHKGEFFGIVGRNGSGKSTLLKILASIYRADAGRVRMAGRVAPFIELGVGFNPELTARENVVLNGVLMGLGRREAQRRLGEVIEFSELANFVDLKLKNYSSGMMVRLAFAIMVQADADIMLIDEVLAVGDAAFAQKCMDVFHEKRQAGKTIVLVTHDMPTVQSLCHRAMLLHDGEMRFIGAPEDAALRYYRLNFAQMGGTQKKPAGEPDVVLDLNVRIVEATLRDPAGGAIENVEQGRPIIVDILTEAARPLEGPTFTCHVVNEDGVVVTAFTRILEQRVETGGRIRLTGEIENRLVAGRYYLDCWVRQDEHQSLMAIQALRLLRFVIYGTAPRHGVVMLETSIEPVLEAPSPAVSDER
ncbi:MAG: ABC transporter ATP-binding protein [Actinomycetota bacterium]|nr:ABC transporter ATP-binding protein [Actinomycetota bacterium]